MELADQAPVDSDDGFEVSDGPFCQVEIVRKGMNFDPDNRT